jgi:hypothetical protein
MNGLICPISNLRINENVARVTAFLIAVLVASYIVFPNPYILLFLGVDFYIRGFTTLKYSPLSWLAVQINELFKWQPHITDKAKKIFSARVGFLFTVAILITFFVSPIAGVILSLILIGFALLESLMNICVGCLVYTYVVFPYFGPGFSGQKP